MEGTSMATGFVTSSLILVSDSSSWFFVNRDDHQTMLMANLGTITNEISNRILRFDTFITDSYLRPARKMFTSAIVSLLLSVRFYIENYELLMKQKKCSQKTSTTLRMGEIDDSSTEITQDLNKNLNLFNNQLGSESDIFNFESQVAWFPPVKNNQNCSASLNVDIFYDFTTVSAFIMKKFNTTLTVFDYNSFMVVMNITSTGVSNQFTPGMAGLNTFSTRTKSSQSFGTRNLFIKSSARANSNLPTLNGIFQFLN